MSSGAWVLGRSRPRRPLPPCDVRQSRACNLLAADPPARASRPWPSCRLPNSIHDAIATVCERRAGGAASSHLAIRPTTRTVVQRCSPRSTAMMCGSAVLLVARIAKFCNLLLTLTAARSCSFWTGTARPRTGIRHASMLSSWPGGTLGGWTSDTKRPTLPRGRL